MRPATRHLVDALRARAAPLLAMADEADRDLPRDPQYADAVAALRAGARAIDQLADMVCVLDRGGDLP